MTRHRDSPLVEGPGPDRKDGRATHQGRVVTRMPYHKETAELRLPGDTRNGPHRVNDGVWYPKQPALFVASDVEECPVPVFGQLPRRFLTKVALPWLKCPRQNVLHVCSGALREKWTVDVRAEVKPKIVADAMALPFRDGAFPAVLLDPPYVPAWARQYGVKYPPTYPLLREAARVTRGGGPAGNPALPRTVSAEGHAHRQGARRLGWRRLPDARLHRLRERRLTVADPTYEDLRAAYINAEARADQLAQRMFKMDAELVATRIVAREAKEALAEAEASSEERGQAANHLIEDLAAEKTAREKAEATNARLIEWNAIARALLDKYGPAGCEGHFTYGPAPGRMEWHHAPDCRRCKLLAVPVE